VAVASLTACAVRQYILGPGPLFPVPLHPELVGAGGLAWCLLVGIAAGAASALLTWMVYGAEDAFLRLPIHWMWWPAIGGLVVGIGGYFFPRALGVGYETIGEFLRGSASPGVIAGVLIVKSIIWAVALGSGTSGGCSRPCS
jgi:H+/Cl- antiporter ClcA